MPPIDEIRLNFTPAALTALNVVLALLMFGIALDARVEDFRRVLRTPRPMVVGLVAQCLLLPAVTVGLALLLGVGPSIALGMILVACCPPGNVSNVLTHRARGNVALSVSMTALSTAVAIVVMPLNLAFWAGLHPGAATLLREISLDPLAMTGHILALILLPFAAGMACVNRFPAFAARIRRVVGAASLWALLAVIVGAVAANWRIFVEHVPAVIPAVALHDTLAFAIGWCTARACGLSDADRRALCMEVGVRHAPLGMVLVFQFFGGLGGMAVVAGLWGIWDVMAGLALAHWWGRRPPVQPQPQSQLQPQSQSQSQSQP